MTELARQQSDLTKYAKSAISNEAILIKCIFSHIDGVNMRNNIQEIFFSSSNRLNQLDINSIYLNMQNQQNLMKQSRENGQKPVFWRQKGKYYKNFEGFQILRKMKILWVFRSKKKIIFREIFFEFSFRMYQASSQLFNCCQLFIEKWCLRLFSKHG